MSKAERREALSSMKAVDVDTRFAALSGDTLRVESRAFFQSTLTKAGATQTLDGRAVRFTMRGFREMAHHSADARVLQIVPSLPQLLKRAIPLFSEANQDVRKTNIVAYHHYGVKASLGGEKFYTRLVVREDNDGHVHYDADATNVEAINNSGETTSTQPNRKPNAGEVSTQLAKNRLHQWWHDVNETSPSPSVPAR
jgi:hypothetical protein